MNKKQRSILSGRKPKYRYSHDTDVVIGTPMHKSDVPIYGVSPLTTQLSEFVRLNNMMVRMTGYPITNVLRGIS